MTWQETLIMLGIFALLAFISFQLGQASERRRQDAREEAIRLQAYKDGRKSIIDEQNQRWSMMSPELYRAMYMGVWTAPEKHNTKER